MTAVFFAPSTTIATYEKLLKIFTADLVLMSWGSCTMYSLYVHDSEMSSVCIANVIVSGNEYEAGWSHFSIFTNATRFLIS